MTNLKTATKFTAKTIAAMAEVAAQFLPAECIKTINGELRLICPEETDELVEDTANYADGGWVGPQGRALRAIWNKFGIGGYEVMQFPGWLCIRKNTEWSPAMELASKNID